MGLTSKFIGGGSQELVEINLWGLELSKIMCIGNVAKLLIEGLHFSSRGEE